MNKKINKIALISPKRPLWSRDSEIAGMFTKNKQFLKPWYSPPLSLLTIAGETPKNIDIEFVDEDFEEIDFSKEYDLVGLSVMTQQAYRAYEIATEFRARGVKVVMGGIHPTVLPEESKKYADTVIIGEGETLWKEFLRDFEMGVEKTEYSMPQNCYIDLSESVIPRYDLIKNEKFKKGDEFFNFIPIQTTRGCPHDCSFCIVSKKYGKKIRTKKIENIVKEVEIVKKNFNDPLFLFVDDNLFVNRKHAIAVLKALIPLKIKWFGQADIRISEDKELLELAYLSGCITLLIGFESLSSNSLSEINDNLWKKRQIAKYNDAVKNIQESGIVVYAAFIVGFEGDTKNTFKEIADFVKKNKCPGQFTFLTPLPGSKVYNDYLEKNKLVKEVYWDECNFFDIVIKHDKLSYEEMQNGLIWLYEDVFNSDENLQRMIYMKNIYKKLGRRWELANSD